jgi:hypothetical protein
MGKVKLDFSPLPLAEKPLRAQQIVASLTGSPTFTTPNPPLAQITAAAAALQAIIIEAQSLRQAARAKVVEQNEQEAALNKMMSQLAAYIDNVAAGDEKLILKSGFSVRAVAVETGGLAPPSGLSATEGDHEGEIDLHWNRVNHARSYVIERSADPPTDTSWTHAKSVSISSATIGGLTRGAKYWFRVAAITSDSQSGWSDPSTRIVS